MGIYKETKDYKLIHDNMLNMANYIENGTIDCIITDPPYELGFMGKKWDGSGIAFNVDAWKKCFNALKDGGYLLAFGGTRTFHRIACAIEDAGFEIRDTIMYLYGSGFPKSLNIGLVVDKLNGVESKILGESSNARPNSKKEDNLYQAGTVGKNFDITLPESDLAKEWDGWGTALKPAIEPIVMARKPLSESTIVNNIIKHGVGGINIDACRVPFGEETDGRVGTDKDNGTNKGFWQKDGMEKVQMYKDDGRFPANIILDGSDEVLAEFPNVDESGAARFFYVAKPSQNEKDYGLYGFKDIKIYNSENGMGYGYKNTNGDDFGDRIAAVERKNFHPTIKPIELMRYLVKMITPKNGIVLEPFAGSGTTLIAAKLESKQYVGIEISQEYCDIAQARIEAHHVQYDLFSFGNDDENE